MESFDKYWADGSATTANTMFLLWCGDVLPKVYIFVQRLVSGTGRGFGTAPQQKHTRCAQIFHDIYDYEDNFHNIFTWDYNEPIFSTSDK